MRQKTEIKILAVLVVLMIGLALLAGCAKKIVGNQEIGVRFEVPTDGIISAKLLATIDRFEVTVEGEGIPERIIEPLALENGFVTGEIEVPSGPRRLFTLKAIGLRGETIYLGISIVDVFAGRTIVVDIPLVPMLPILSITPHYQEAEMGNLFTLDFVLHNVKNIAYISFDIDVLTDGIYTNGPFGSLPISSTPGRDIDTNLTTFGYAWGDFGLYAWVNSRNEVDDFTNPTGTTHLGSLTFSSYADWHDTIASSVFNTNVTWVNSSIQDTTMTADKVFSDQAEVFLWYSPGGGL